MKMLWNGLQDWVLSEKNKGEVRCDGVGICGCVRKNLAVCTGGGIAFVAVGKGNRMAGVKGGRLFTVCSFIIFNCWILWVYFLGTKKYVKMKK